MTGRDAVYINIFLQDAAKESRMKFASLVEELLAACDRRTALYVSFDAALDKFKQGHDSGVFSSSLKKLRNDYTTLTQTINDICASIVKEDAESAEKVSIYSLH